MERKIAISRSPREKLDSSKYIKQTPQFNLLSIYDKHRVHKRNANRALESVLSILPSYLRLTWALIIDANKRNIVAVYPEHIRIADMLENVTAMEKFLEEKHEDFQRIGHPMSCKNAEGNVLVCSNIDDRYTMILNLPPDIPLNPAKEMCQHMKLVLKQILKTNESHPFLRKYPELTDITNML